MVEHIVESVHRLLLDNLPIRTNTTPSGWRTFDCPMCSDQRKRAGIIIGGPKISYHCFNCSFTTGWSPNPHLGRKYRDLADKMGADTKTIHGIQILLMQNSELLQNTETV